MTISTETESLNSPDKIHQEEPGHDNKRKSLWGRAKHRGAALGRFFPQKAKLYYKKSAVFLGINARVPEQTKKADIATYLREMQQHYRALPESYRRLFDHTTHPQKEYLVGLKEQISKIEEACEREKRSVARALAVMGEKGSGKSTCVNLAQAELFSSQRVLRINLAEGGRLVDDLPAWFNGRLPDVELSSMEEVVTYLAREKPYDLIILDDLQCLYLRNLNGYEALEQLMYIIVETSEQVFWIASCSRYAWAYLSETFGLDDYFSSIVETDRLDEQHIEKLILTRHRASDYELVFAASKSEASRRTYGELLGDEDKKQDNLQKKFFAKLAKVAGGNASVAMIFWLQSVQKFEQGYCFIAPLEDDVLKIVDDLSPEVLFILAALVLHGSLKSEELACTQNVATGQGLLSLKKLEARGMVTHAAGSFTLNHLLYRPVIKELEERNILHL